MRIQRRLFRLLVRRRNGIRGEIDTPSRRRHPNLDVLFIGHVYLLSIALLCFCFCFCFLPVYITIMITNFFPFFVVWIPVFYVPTPPCV